jgi:hypothetical protein
MPRSITRGLKWQGAGKRLSPRRYNPAIPCFHAGINYHKRNKAYERKTNMENEKKREILWWWKDPVELFEHLMAAFPGSILTSFHTIDYEGRQTKQCWIFTVDKIQAKNCCKNNIKNANSWKGKEKMSKQRKKKQNKLKRRIKENSQRTRKEEVGIFFVLYGANSAGSLNWNSTENLRLQAVSAKGRRGHRSKLYTSARHF